MFLLRNKYLLFLIVTGVASHFGTIPIFVVVIYIAAKCFADPGSSIALHTEKMEKEILDGTAQYLINEIHKVPVAEMYLGICLVVAIIGAAVVLVCGRFFERRQERM
ncbi:hypothetical protein [Brevibacillus brevis]|uniref:Uncharacterized protein n=1 Tax=Brevibacillus brevis TaxID=1393 RepID=A0ABY9TDF5_BREBE|nr:hypothetical protein [Brevibacillus brevis]WNC17927.1 hypothetical protein RGB73_30190 [Brevibacillus brevis]